MMLEKESPVSFVLGFVNHERDTSHDDFAPLERTLREQRPSPTDGELDRIHHRAVSAAARTEGSRRRIFSPARLAMVSLVSGLLLVGGSSASLAVSGLSSDGSAGKAQYIQTPSTAPNTDTGAVQPSEDEGGDCPAGDMARSSQTDCPDETTPSLNPPVSDVVPAADEGDDPAQETRQVSEGGSDNRLPFTGLMALPLMLVGVLLLGTGFVLRRSSTSTQKLG